MCVDSHYGWQFFRDPVDSGRRLWEVGRNVVSIVVVRGEIEDRPLSMVVYKVRARRIILESEPEVEGSFRARRGIDLGLRTSINDFIPGSLLHQRVDFFLHFCVCILDDLVPSNFVHPRLTRHHKSSRHPTVEHEIMTNGPCSYSDQRHFLSSPQLPSSQATQDHPEVPPTAAP